jgi:hypothetical protein
MFKIENSMTKFKSYENLGTKYDFFSSYIFNVNETHLKPFGIDFKLRLMLKIIFLSHNTCRPDSPNQLLNHTLFKNTKKKLRIN